MKRQLENLLPTIEFIDPSICPECSRILVRNRGPYCGGQKCWYKISAVKLERNRRKKVSKKRYNDLSEE